MDEQKHDGVTDGAELVLEAMAPAPSAPFLLKTFDVHGKLTEKKVRFRVLRKTESIAAIVDAQRRAKELGELDAKYGDIYRECKASAIIVRALCKDEIITPQDSARAPYYRPYFTSSQQLETAFSESEIAQCLNAYEITRAKFSAFESFDPDEIDKWAARLSDTLHGPLYLSLLDSGHWPGLLTSLAQEVASLRESLGRPLPSLRDSSESARPSSESGTGGSTTSLHERSTDGTSPVVPTPSDRLLTRQEARALAKKKRK